MKKRSIIAIESLILLVALSCAKRGFPPGGPEDTVPPFVAEIEPKGGSTGVALGAQIRIVFSEKMKKRSVESNIAVSPHLKWRKRYWKGLELVMVPEEGLSPNTTYIVSISGKATDSHGVAMGNTFCSGFSTGDSLSSGSINGKVFWKKVAVEGATVRVVEADVEIDEGIWAENVGLVTFSGKAGLYGIPYLDRSKRYQVLALLDDNSNQIYDTGEKIGCFPGLIMSTESKVVDSVEISLCEKGLSGTVRGNVGPGIIDTIPVVARLVSVEDTTLTLYAGLGSDLVFEIQCVKPGRYLLGLFEDPNGNRKMDPDERMVLEFADTILVERCRLTELTQIGGER